MFYRSVFGGEFNGSIQRCWATMCSLETDAPESMGFKLVQGNNAHIKLEPDTRAEAERLFNGLSAGGEVEMPLQVLR